MTNPPFPVSSSMDPSAVAHSWARIRKAEKSLIALEAASNYEEAEEAWSDFLLAASGVYSKLEQGAKTKGSSAGWFGRKRRERKDDPLMRYLHYARNSDEHGIERTAERGGNLVDPLTGPLKFNERHHYIIESVDGGPPIKTDGYLWGPSLQMIRVHDRRFNDYCDPPTEHLGKVLTAEDISIMGIASLGLEYLKQLVSDAEKL